MEIPDNVKQFANQHGWAITIQNNGVVEFKHNSRRTPFYLTNTDPESWQTAIEIMRETVNHSLSDELVGKAEISTGIWKQGQGYQYRHNRVLFDGVEIGFVQERKGTKNDMVTCFGNSCVVGKDMRWLIAQALGNGTIKI
jgi:hypothetical protein